MAQDSVPVRMPNEKLNMLLTRSAALVDGFFAKKPAYRQTLSERRIPDAKKQIATGRKLGGNVARCSVPEVWAYAAGKSIAYKFRAAMWKLLAIAKAAPIIAITESGTTNTD